MACGKGSSNDAFARWGTLAPCPSTDAGAAANPGAWAGPRSETPPTLKDARRSGDNVSRDAPAFTPPPLRLLQQRKGQAASRATAVDRGTMAPGAGAKIVSFAEQPGAGGGPVRSVMSLPSSASIQRTSEPPLAFPTTNTSTASTRSSGHGVPSSARATLDLNSYVSSSSDGGSDREVKRGVVAGTSSSSNSGDGASDADALLARLAGKAKQAAAAALSASRAGTTAPLLLEPFGVDDSLERQTSIAEGTSRRAIVATSLRTSDYAGGFESASAEVATSVATGAGAGSADGARLAQLCKEDKAKVARLMQDLAKLRAEKDGHKARFERLRVQNEEIVKEVASLRVKFGQSMQLLRKYQNIVQEGEIAGGRATAVGDAGNGLCPVTDSGMADDIRSLREALQAAERRSQKAETEAMMERASRSAMSEELRKVRADAADLRKQLERHLPTPTAAAPATAPSPPRQACPPPAAAATAAPATWSEAHEGSAASQSSSSRRPAPDSEGELRAVSRVRRPPVSSASAPPSNSAGGSGSGSKTLPGEAGIVPQPSHAAGDIFGGAGWFSSGDASAGGAGKRGHGGSGTAHGTVVGVSTINEGERGEDIGPMQRRGEGGGGDGDSMGREGEGEERALAATAAIETLQKQVEALKQDLAMVGVRQLTLAAGGAPGVLGGARKDAEHWGASSFGATFQKEFQRSEKASTRGKVVCDEKDARRRPVVLEVREGVKGGARCYSDGSGSDSGDNSSSIAFRDGDRIDDNTRGGWERSDHGKVDRRGSKGLAAGVRSLSGSVSGWRATTHLEEEDEDEKEDEEEDERRERSLSRGISTATARRPRTWFETASDDLRDGRNGSDSDRGLQNLGRRRSKGVVNALTTTPGIKGEQQEPRHCGVHRSASARRRKTGVVQDELDEEACGGTAAGHYRGGREGGGDAGAAAPQKLRVSWSSVSVRSEETVELGGDDETSLGAAADPGRRRRRGAASTTAPTPAPRGRNEGGAVAPRTDAFPFPKPPPTAVPPPLSSKISQRREGGAPRASSGLIRGHLHNRDYRESSAAGEDKYRGGSCRWVSRHLDRPGDASSTDSTASAASRRAVFNTRRLPREVEVKSGGAPAAKTGVTAGPPFDTIGVFRGAGRRDDRKPSHHADRHSQNLRGPDGGGPSGDFFDKSLLDLIDDIEGEEGGVDGARFDPDGGARARTAPRRAIDPRRRDRRHRGMSGAGMGYP